MSKMKKKLSAFINLLKEKDLLVETKNFKEVEILDITYNSKNVKANTLFFAKGEHFKPAYLEDAINRGAKAYVSEHEYPVDKEVTSIIVSDIRLAMSVLANFFFDYPSKDLTTIAVCGTKGKTTTAYFLKSVLDTELKKEGEKPCGLISSIIYFAGEKAQESSNTTPEAIELQRLLKQGVDRGLKYFVIEVSSQALKYERVEGVAFDYLAYLNISEDHISPMEHKDFQDYFASGAKSFSLSKKAILNLDDKYYEANLKEAKKAKNLESIQTISLENTQADRFVEDIDLDRYHTSFTTTYLGKKERFKLAIQGAFNIYNALACILIAEDLHISLESLQAGLAKVKVPGRMQSFESEDGLLTIVVDYAHNKLSFEALWPDIASLYKDYEKIAIFGAPGNKARNRREELGQIAAKYADKIILTMEDPDTESLESINKRIIAQIEKTNTPYLEIADRREALFTAVKSVQDKKTVIVITGKSHETSQKIQGKYYPIPTDIEIAEEAMDLYNQNKL